MGIAAARRGQGLKPEPRGEVAKLVAGYVELKGRKVEGLAKAGERVI